MKIVRDLGNFPALPRGSVATIGNFDGVHLGHQQLLSHVVDTARNLGNVAVVITFEPHPIRVLAPERAPKILISLQRKAERIERQGIDLLVVLPFTRQLAHLSPEDFTQRILRDQIAARSIWVGPNFRFGYRQAGDVQMLEKLSHTCGFIVNVVRAVRARGEIVSSTRIRQLLSAGRPHLAGRLLGRPFSNSGAIVSGAGIGKHQTVPTLNLGPVDQQLPAIGVYVTRTRLAQACYPSVTNVGHKPTFGNHDLSVETYLLNFRGEVRETEMEIEYLHRLRDEIKFQNPAMLKAQIQDDVRRALKFFRWLEYFRQQSSAASLRQG